MRMGAWTSVRLPVMFFEVSLWKKKQFAIENYHSEWVNQLFKSEWDWFEGQFAGKPHILWGNRWFPVKILNQSNES